MLFKFDQERIIILGLNYIALNLARKLSVDRDVVILCRQNKPAMIENYNIDVMIERMKPDPVTCLRSHNINNSVRFMAVTSDDEFNLFIAHLAGMMGAKLTMARIIKNSYREINFNIDLLLNPRQIIVDKINTVLKETGLKNIKSLVPGRINISQISVTENDTFSYARLRNIKQENGLIIAIRRNERMFIPRAEVQLQPGDTIFILYKRGIIDWLYKFKPNFYGKKKLFIIGSGNLTEYLIEYWRNIFTPIIIIEPDRRRCNQLAERFETPIILQGRGTDMQLLREEGLDRGSVFIAGGNNDLHNLLSSFGARKLGCSNIMTLINNPENREIAGSLELKNLIYKPELVADYINSFIKTGLEIDKFILGNKIYTSKLKISPASGIKGKRLKNCKLPEGVIVGVIIRDDAVMIPDGESVLRENDRIIVFFSRDLESRIKHIF